MFFSLSLLSKLIEQKKCCHFLFKIILPADFIELKNCVNLQEHKLMMVKFEGLDFTGLISENKQLGKSIQRNLQ